MGKGKDTSTNDETINEKEDEYMNANTIQFRRLDFNKISNRIVGTISSEEALKNITPIQWSEDVLSGKKKVIITKEKDAE